MKICSRCSRELPLDEFLNKKFGLKRSECKECSREYCRQHYKNNKKTYLEKNIRRKKENRIKILKFLMQNPCSICGETDLVVLEFDHINPQEKKFEVSRMILEGYSWAVIFEEIKKCQVLCANCHKRKTAIQQGWYKNIKK